MDSRILTDSILSNFPYDPTPDQRRFIEQFGDFLYSGNQNEVMLVTGYAGTGKTTLVASLVQVLRALNKGFVLLAPTGRAAKVLSQYSGFPASTIHKKIEITRDRDRSNMGGGGHGGSFCQDPQRAGRDHDQG